MRVLIFILVLILILITVTQLFFRDRIDLVAEITKLVKGKSEEESYREVAEFPEPPYVQNPHTALWAQDLSKQKQLVPLYKAGGRKGSDGRLRFYIPADLAADSSGNVYVLDKGYGRIVQIGPDGKFVRYIYYRQDSQTPFQKPYLLTIDRQNRFYIVDDLNRLIIFKDDREEKKIDLSFRPYDLCVDQRGYIYFLTPSEPFRLHKFSPRGKEILAFSPQEKSEKSLWEVFSRGFIAVDGDTLYYSQEYPYRIIKYNPDGVPVLVFNRDLGILVTPPTIHRDGFGKVVSVNRQQMTFDIKVMPDGLILNLTKTRGGKGGDILDVFDRKGQYVLSIYLGKNYTRMTLVGSNGIALIRPYPFEQVERYEMKSLFAQTKK